MYLSEVCQLLVDEFGISVSPPTICRLLKSYGITHKKIQQVALQRCYSLRGAFMAQCFLINSVFVSGSGKRSHLAQIINF